MELSILLAKLMGLYLMLEGLVLLTQRKAVIHIVNDLSRERALMFVTGAMVVILGLLVILNHNIWDGTWRVLPTLIGWILVVKGILVLFVPGIMMNFGKKFAQKRNLAVLSGVVALAVGAYLVYVGFGLGV
jgi:uncharacterized membrane protein